VEERDIKLLPSKKTGGNATINQGHKSRGKWSALRNGEPTSKETDRKLLSTILHPKIGSGDFLKADWRLHKQLPKQKLLDL